LRIQKQLADVDEELSLEEARFYEVQMKRRQKKLRLRKNLDLLSEREKSLLARELQSIEELERLEYEAAKKDGSELEDSHPYHAALSLGIDVPAGEAPPSSGEILSRSSLPPSSNEDPLVDWTSDPLMMDPNSDFWKTVDFGDGTPSGVPVSSGG
jgi:hypothetical protein